MFAALGGTAAAETPKALKIDSGRAKDGVVRLSGRDATQQQHDRSVILCRDPPRLVARVVCGLESD